MQRIVAICVLGLVSILGAWTARAETPSKSFLARLTPEQRQVYGEWHAARLSFKHRHDRYWATIDARKAKRRRKHSAGQPITLADYVVQHPPQYTGPKLRADIAKLMRDSEPPSPPGKAADELPTVADFLRAARKHYRFIPTRTTEREFKRRYAAEALAVGLTKEQVVRIYGLETGGRGTYDMQAGINPQTGKGRAISTALGYAQLLAANSIDEVVRHGQGFIARLKMMAADRNTPPERAMELTAKADSLRSMLTVARSVPRRWRHHQSLATTERGYGIHAINMDADIGPWIQVLKLLGLKDLAERKGRPPLSGAEIELMNLAGPQTGLDMMQPVAHKASTANFFSRRGYYRNSIVRWKSAHELLLALDEKMNATVKNDGALEFAAVFDELIAARRQNRSFSFTAKPPPASSSAPHRSEAAREGIMRLQTGKKAATPSWLPFEVP